MVTEINQPSGSGGLKRKGREEILRGGEGLYALIEVRVTQVCGYKDSFSPTRKTRVSDGVFSNFLVES